MKELSNPYNFIHMGLCIRLLMHCEGHPIGWLADEAEKLLQNITFMNFYVTQNGVGELKDFIAVLKKDSNLKRSITKAEHDRLFRIMGTVEKLVYAEAQTKHIFVVSECRFSLDSLLNHPEKIFAQGIFLKLPEISRYDIREAFSCLVFSRPTAAAFHVLRATEAVLRNYYLIKVKRGRVDKLLWGVMVAELMSKRDKEERLLQKLDLIRSSYRNPTAHPEARYNMDEAQDLVGLCIDAINCLAKSIP